MVYIRQSALPNLRQYKYSGVDHSLLSQYLLKPFYNNVAIRFFPQSMAPNLITLTGFGFVVVNLFTLLWYNPTLDQDCPGWVYVTFSIGLFLYQTFDAVDGTQARRTGQSGPLGELFDHGVDAVNTTLEVLLFAGSMNMGQSWSTVTVLFACLLTFYVQTWEEYHTHVLTLGAVSGPVEGIVTLCVVFALTARLGGGHFWQQSAMASVGLEKNLLIPELIYSLSWVQWFLSYGAGILVYNTASSFMNVAEARRKNGLNVPKAFAGLLPFAATWLLVPAYLLLQPTILHQHLIPFAFFVGLINALSVGQIITKHLVKSKFPHTYANPLIPALAWGVVDSLGPFLQRKIGLGWPSALSGTGERADDDVYVVAYVFLCLGMSIGVYGSFVVDVILTICDYLDIWCLTIKHPKGEEQKLRVQDSKKAK